MFGKATPTMISSGTFLEPIAKARQPSRHTKVEITV
jgi:hypothetical protein